MTHGRMGKTLRGTSCLRSEGRDVLLLLECSLLLRWSKKESGGYKIQEEEWAKENGRGVALSCWALDCTSRSIFMTSVLPSAESCES